MSVYIEVVIFNNFFLDMALLYATATVRRRKFRRGRSIFAAVIGTACATAYMLLPEWTKIVMTVLLAPALCAIAIGASGKDALHKFGDFLGSTLLFVLLTYFAGGIVYGISIALNVDIRSYALIGLLSIAVIALILCAKLIAGKRSKSADTTCKTTVNINGRTVSAEALCDSGNLLVDDVSGLPVVILSKELEEELGIRCPNGFVSVNTVSGEDSLPVVDIDEICVNGRAFRALGALSRKSFASFDLILQSSMF